MKSESVRIPVPVCIDLRFGASASDKGIVGWNASVVAESQHFSDMVAEVLRFHAEAVVVFADAAEPVTITDGHI